MALDGASLEAIIEGVSQRLALSKETGPLDSGGKLRHHPLTQVGRCKSSWSHSTSVPAAKLHSWNVTWHARLRGGGAVAAGCFLSSYGD